MALVGVVSDGGLLALLRRLFGFGGFWKRVSVTGFGFGGFWKRVSFTGTGGGMLASFAPLIALALGGFEKLAALPR